MFMQMLRIYKVHTFPLFERLDFERHLKEIGLTLQVLHLSGDVLLVVQKYIA